jgi:hypothetical protein
MFLRLLLFVGWGETDPLDTSVINASLVLTSDVEDDGWAAICEMIIGRGNRRTQRKPAPIQLCPK